MILRRLALLTACGLILTACSTDDATQQDDTVQAKPKAEIEQLVKDAAEATAAPTDIEITEYRARSAPCDTTAGAIAEDGAWNLTAFGVVLLSSDQHLTALQKVKQSWTEKGWEITEDRTLPGGVRGALSGRDPATGLTASLTSSNPPKQLGLIVSSTCYKPVAGEDPAND